MKIPQTEILLFVMREGVPNVLLNRYSAMSEEDYRKEEPSSGIYRPTICCAEKVNTFGTLMENIARELGVDVFPMMTSLVWSKKEVEHPTKTRFVMMIPSGLEEKFRHPYYSGGIHPVSKVHVADVIEIPIRGSAPLISNRIPMFDGGKEFLLAGFEIFSK